MNTLSGFVWLTRQAATVPIYLWVSTTAVVLVSGTLLVCGWRGFSRMTWRFGVLLASFYLAPLLILFWAALMQHSDAFASAPHWPIVLHHLSLILLLGSAALVIWKAIGVRLIASATLLGALWLSYCAAFIASMALRNNWL